ncbi:hypothetical protein [uncultured Sphingomonas sp.]|uniref:hypothetical protein n=1 Tax=uncultured Sphingomonas sp. TaxID=158754 RepID=UPI00344F560D
MRLDEGVMTGNIPAVTALYLYNFGEDNMGATTIGALVGAAIDKMSGDDDSSVDGAIKGAVVANVLRVVAPMAITYAVGWAVLRGATELKAQLFETEDAA